MRTKVMLLTAMLLVTASLAQAQWGVDQIDGTLDVTYHSAYMWRGFDVYSGAHGEGAIQPNLDLNLGGGFGVYAEYLRANTSGFEDAQRLNASLYYGDTVLQAEPWETDYTVGYTFYSFPNLSVSNAGMSELFARASMPQLIGGGLTPYLGTYYAWNTRSGGVADKVAAGWMHQLGLGYDYRLEGITADMPAMDLSFYSELWYNGNAWGFLSDSPQAGADGSVDHDWSHWLLGVTTDMPVAEGWTLTPGLHYQHRLDKAIADAPTVLWATVGLSYQF